MKNIAVYSRTQEVSTETKMSCKNCPKTSDCQKFCKEFLDSLKFVKKLKVYWVQLTKIRDRPPGNAHGQWWVEGGVFFFPPEAQRLVSREVVNVGRQVLLTIAHQVARVILALQKQFVLVYITNTCILYKLSSRKWLYFSTLLR